MNESLISVRYAAALFSLAKEKNLLSELKNDMEIILEVSNQSSDFNRFLISPVVKPSDKVKVLKLIFGKKISELSLKFLQLIVRNKRELFLQAISRDVLDFIRKEKNIKTAVITTAQSIDKATLKKAKMVLEKELSAKVELTARVNPRFIGGMVLRIDDKQYDATILSQLNKLKQEMLKAQL